MGNRCVIMSARPGRVKDIIDIDIPYPRDQATKMSPRFLELKNEIWSQVYQESTCPCASSAQGARVARHSRASDPAPSSPSGPKRTACGARFYQRRRTPCPT